MAFASGIPPGLRQGFSCPLYVFINVFKLERGVTAEDAHVIDGGEADYWTRDPDV